VSRRRRRDPGSGTGAAAIGAFRARRRPDVTLPDATIIELNTHAIGRIDSALVARVDDEMPAEPVELSFGLGELSFGAGS